MASCESTAASTTSGAVCRSRPPRVPCCKGRSPCHRGSWAIGSRKTATMAMAVADPESTLDSHVTRAFIRFETP
ncbi:MAG: hypothetical protein ACFFCS_16170 [Candidatus Hodarchaeota archaeon]